MKKLAILVLAFFLLMLPFTREANAQTTFGEDSGIYGQLLNDLKSTLSDKHVKTVTLDGKPRTMFVSWV
jgi:hypothetical protein